jgi:predicted metal-dependent phosphoesterase TrpH
MRYADLHTHTYHSDGTRSPKEVIDVARAAGLRIVAISDHDNVAAYFEIRDYAASQDVLLVPATELSCGWRGADIHVLAYAFDPLDERLEQRLRHFRETRQSRGQAMIARLRAAGYPVRSERVDELAGGGSMGRPHLARALVEAGHAASVQDAFKRLLRPGTPGFVEKERFDIEEAVALVHAAGGVTSVAHPTLYPNHGKLIPEILDMGIDAIEVMHPEVSEGMRQHYAQLALSRGKFTTGGSDDHGTVKEKETLGTVRVPEEWIGAIVERMT